MKDDRLYLIHISECIERIENYLAGKNLQTFMESDLLQDAVIRNLQVLSESTQRLSDATKQSQSEGHQAESERNSIRQRPAHTKPQDRTE